MLQSKDFSFQTRRGVLDRFANEEFDLLVVGGGITGAAVARDAALRGLSVALAEKRDFAWGTSSRSSKLIHGGLRYLQNREFKLVFESLGERAHLLKMAPNLVRPLKFYLPVYDGGPRGKGILNLGLWLYDSLSLFRSLGAHKNLSREKFLGEVPFIRPEGLKGGFCYFDASMWDDLLVVETLRDAARHGAAVANYAEAKTPLFKGDKLAGFRVVDRESPARHEFSLTAKKIVLCGGPWTDELGQMISPDWKPWLVLSKGIHLVFDLEKIPVPGAVLMSHPTDGRIAFVIPRPDFGKGVVLVGTTDAPTSNDPVEAGVDKKDVSYLMELMDRYFPGLHLKVSDALSAYVGVRPLVANHTASLQKISREHFIGEGPGGAVIVAGGKYTTHRTMAKEIVDFTLNRWEGEIPRKVKAGRTREPVNPAATKEAMEDFLKEAQRENRPISRELVERYAAESLEVLRLVKPEDGKNRPSDPAGFPELSAQLRFAIRHEMVIHLEDFYLRRVPLFLSRADHGLPWAEALSRVWAIERGGNESQAREEVENLKTECERRDLWRKNL